MLTAREKVEAVWKRVAHCDRSYRNYARGTVLLQDVNGDWFDFPSWQAAWEFIRARLDAIQQLDEELAEIQYVLGSGINGDDGKPWLRILDRLSAIRDELKKGMR